MQVRCDGYIVMAPHQITPEKAIDPLTCLCAHPSPLSQVLGRAIFMAMPAHRDQNHHTTSVSVPMYLSLSQFSECLSVFNPKEEKKYLLSLFSCKCPTLCTPVDCSQPGFPVLHYLPEFIQTLVHWVGDAIQPSHPLSPPSPPALNLSQHQGLFLWAGSLHQVAKVLQLQLQHQSF